jgi:hypothetical protein
MKIEEAKKILKNAGYIVKEATISGRDHFASKYAAKDEIRYTIHTFASIAL